MSGSLLGRAERAANQTKVPQTNDRLGFGTLVRRTLKEVGDDHVGAFAGNLTYHTFLAIFPFALVVLSVLFLAGEEGLLRDGVTNLEASGALSSGAADVIIDQIESLAASTSGSLGWGLVLSVVVALWAVSGAMRSIMEAMNVMYEVTETRSFVGRYVNSLLMSLLVAALFTVALGLIVVGPSIAAQVGDVGRWAWLILQWPVAIGFVLLGIALVYYVAPAVDQDWKWITQGSIFATTLWLVFSLAFSAYVNNFGSYNETYGALAGVVILLLYTFYTSFIVLIGAEINQLVEAAAPDGKNPGERTVGDAERA